MAGSVFEFADFDLGTSRNRCAELEDQQKGMKRKINPKVMNMIDRCATLDNVDRGPPNSVAH